MSQTKEKNGRYFYKKTLISRIVMHSVAILALLLFFLAPCFEVAINEGSSLLGLDFNFAYVNEVIKVKSLLFDDNSAVANTLNSVRFAIAQKMAWVTLILFILFLAALVEQIAHLVANIISLTHFNAYLYRRNEVLKQDNKKVSALKKFPSTILFKMVIIAAAIHYLMIHIISPMQTEDTQSAISYFLLMHKPNFVFWAAFVLAIATVVSFIISVLSLKKGAMALIEESNAVEESAEESQPQTEEPTAEPEKTEPVKNNSSVTIFLDDEEDEEEPVVEDDDGLNSDEMPDDLQGYGKSDNTDWMADDDEE